MPQRFLHRAACDRACVSLIAAGVLIAALGDLGMISLVGAARAAEPATNASPATNAAAATAPGRLRTDVKPKRTLTGHTQPVRELVVWDHGAGIVSADDDGIVILWNLENDKPQYRWTEAQGAKITALLVSPDRSRVAAGDDQGRLHIWDATSGESVYHSPKQSAGVARLAGNPAGDQFVAALADDAVVHFAPPAEPVVVAFKAPRPIRGLAVLPNGRKILVAYDDSKMETRTLPAGKVGRWREAAGPDSLAGMWVENEVILYAQGDQIVRQNPRDHDDARPFAHRSPGLIDVSTLDNPSAVYGVNRTHLTIWTAPAGAELVRRPHPFADAVTLRVVDWQRLLVARPDGKIEEWNVSEFAPHSFDLTDKLAERLVPLLVKGDYDSLEAELAEIRKNSVRTPEGTTTLALACEALGRFDEDWEAGVELLQDWCDDQPESPIAHAVLASALVSWAWEARGSGVASTITPEGRQLFGDRLRKAHRVVTDGMKLKDPPASLYATAIDVAKGLCQPKDEVKRLLAEGQKIDHREFQLYRAAIEFFLPRWFGEVGEGGLVMKEAIQSLPKDDGLEMYFRALAHARLYDGERAFANYEDALILNATKVIVERYPDDVGLNQFSLYIAYRFDDFATAKLVHEAAGRAPQESAFSPEEWEAAQDWYAMEFDPSRPEFRLHYTTYAAAIAGDGSVPAAAGLHKRKGHVVRFWRPGEGRIAEFRTSPNAMQNLAADPAARWAAVGLGDGGKTTGLGLFDVAKGELVATLDETKHLASFTFSPDGKRLLTGRTDDQAVHIYDVENPTGPFKSVALSSRAYRVEFSPNGRQLVLPPNKTSVIVLDAATGTTARTIELDVPKPVGAGRQAFSGDGKRYVAAGLSLIVACDWETGANVVSRAEDKTWGGPLAVSPDGSLVAAARNDNGDPNLKTDFGLLDGRTLEVKERFVGHAKAIVALSFSADGKTLISVGRDGEVRRWDVSQHLAK